MMAADRDVWPEALFIRAQEHTPVYDRKTRFWDEGFAEL
jgi:hypothetical protein